MGLVQTKCNNCGSIISVDIDRKKGFCPYCGAEYYLSDDIVNNYSTTNVNINHATIVSKQKDFVIKAGVLVEYVGEDVDIVIPDNVQIIGESCFSKQTVLRSVKCGKNLFKIEESAFYMCKNLKQINLENVKAIGNNAFESTALQKINLNNVEIIGQKAFANCIGISEVTIPRTCLNIGGWAFFGCNCGNRMIINIPTDNCMINDNCWDWTTPKGFFHKHKKVKY